MDIEFATSEIQALCEKKRLMTKTLGDACARKLRTRIADLAAAATVTDLVAGRPHPLKGNRLGQFAVDLHGGKRLVFEVTNDPVPQTQDGAVAWGQVTKVKIVFIGDYHD